MLQQCHLQATGLIWSGSPKSEREVSSLSAYAGQSIYGETNIVIQLNVWTHFHSAHREEMGRKLPTFNLPQSLITCQ